MKTDLTGRVIGRFTVLREAEQRGVNRYWVCRCECGTIKEVCQGSLKHGKTNSCGCYNKEVAAERETTHGRSKDPIYNLWCMIKRRCSDPKNISWANYGGRGIQMCERWSKSFTAFVSDMGERPFPAAQIDRIDNNGNYTPENCRWVSPAQQSRNKRDNALLTFNGETMCLADWDDKLGYPPGTVNNRKKLGWSVERMLTQKVRGY